MKRENLQKRILTIAEMHLLGIDTSEYISELYADYGEQKVKIEMSAMGLSKVFTLHQKELLQEQKERDL